MGNLKIERVNMNNVGKQIKDKDLAFRNLKLSDLTPGLAFLDIELIGFVNEDLKRVTVNEKTLILSDKSGLSAQIEILENDWYNTLIVFQEKGESKSSIIGRLVTKLQKAFNEK